MLPSIAVNRFVNPEPQTREFKAMTRALELKPDVHLIGTYECERYFRVCGRHGHRYTVALWLDAQTQEPQAQCSCEAAYIPQEPVPCYHIGSVLIHEAEV